MKTIGNLGMKLGVSAMGHWMDDDTILFNDVRGGRFSTVVTN